MALPAVSIEIQNGGLGQVIPTDDAIVGLMLQCSVAPAGLSLATAKQIFSLSEAEAVGIDAAYDGENEVKCWKHIKEFYDEAGTGAELWIIVISQATTMAQMCDKTLTHASLLLNAAAGKIRVLGVTRSPSDGYTPDDDDGIDADVYAAITKAQALAVEQSAAFKPLRIILEGHAFNGTAGDLTDLKTLTDNRVAVIIGDTVSGVNAAVGLLLGRISKIPVQRNIGRVKDLALSIATAYLGTTALSSAESSVAAIHNKGFVTFRRHAGLAGYYFTDDPTATGATDDFNSLARGRVVDKAIVLAYRVYVQEILDEILIDSFGRISAAKTGYYQAIIDNQVNQAMTANGEISSFSSYVDPVQNVLSTGKVCVELRIVPVGYAKEILIKLGFDNPANA